MLPLLVAGLIAAAPDPSLMPRQQVLEEIARIEQRWPSETPPVIVTCLGAGLALTGAWLYLQDSFSTCVFCRGGRTKPATDFTTVGLALVGTGTVAIVVGVVLFGRMDFLRAPTREWHQFLMERLKVLDEVR